MTCEYCDAPVYKNGMCEDCYAEDEWERTCPECDHLAIGLATSPFTGNTLYVCDRGHRWI